MIIILPTKRISALCTVKNICESFTHKMTAKASWNLNYITVTLYITISVFRNAVASSRQHANNERPVWKRSAIPDKSAIYSGRV